MAQPIIFISYSHKDKLWKERLVNHLAVLHGEEGFSLWHDSLINAGDDWLPAITAALQQASVAILLISSDFLNSPFILKKEIPVLLQRRHTEGVRIFPVIVKTCAWKRVPWLSSLQSFPKNGKALYELPGDRRNQEFTKIVEEVCELLKTSALNPTTPLAGATPEQKQVITPAEKLELWGRTVIPSLGTTSQPTSGGDSKVQWLSNWKYILSLAVMALLVALFITQVTHKEPKPYCAEVFDSLSEKEDPWLPANLRWSIPPNGISLMDLGWESTKVLAGTINGRLVEGGKMGLIGNSTKKTEPYWFEDFTLLMQVSIYNKGEVNWVIRAKNASNYYLFRLSVSQYTQQIEAHRYENGESVRKWGPLNIPGIIKESPNNIDIKTIVKGSNFKVEVKANSHKAIESGLTDFYPILDWDDNAFKGGGIGLFPEKDTRVLLHQFHVIPAC